ncbi:hypothetical protein MRB53_022659 [Persea americana]|uniref:Uncharacterized protein n=1 Tax=Persea americana TaxID=3435 RepID=A0ACC2L735_PERAE|nr:hypothetical protein MRB53_022659 [Persea americana]
MLPPDHTHPPRNTTSTSISPKTRVSRPIPRENGHLLGFSGEETAKIPFSGGISGRLRSTELPIETRKRGVFQIWWKFVRMGFETEAFEKIPEF